MGKIKMWACLALLVLATALSDCGLVVHKSRAESPSLFAQPQEEPKAAVPADKRSRASKLDLTPESMPKLHALIRPHENEWRHLRVHWLTDSVAVLKKAATEDKPIVYLYLGGAGYNAPLGVC